MVFSVPLRSQTRITPSVGADGLDESRGPVPADGRLCEYVETKSELFILRSTARVSSSGALLFSRRWR